MIRQTAFLLAAGMALAACEPERGAGFTGIGPTQSSQSAYSLDFKGLKPAKSGSVAQGAVKADR